MRKRWTIVATVVFSSCAGVLAIACTDTLNHGGPVNENDGAPPPPSPCVVSVVDISTLCSTGEVLDASPVIDAGADTGASDADTSDAESSDADTSDAGTIDAGANDAGVVTGCPITSLSKVTCDPSSAGTLARGGTDNDYFLVTSAGDSQQQSHVQVVTIGADGSGSTEQLSSPILSPDERGVAMVVDSAKNPGFFASTTNGVTYFSRVAAGWSGSVIDVASEQAYAAAASNGTIAALYTTQDGLFAGTRGSSATAFTPTALATGNEIFKGTLALDGAGAPWAAYFDNSGANAVVKLAGPQAPANPFAYEGNARALSLTIAGGAAFTSVVGTNEDESVGEGTILLEDGSQIPFGGPQLPAACNVSSIGLLSCDDCPQGQTCQSQEEDVLTAALATTSDGAVWLVEESVLGAATWVVNASSSLAGLVCTCGYSRQSVTSTLEVLTIVPIRGDGSFGEGFRTPMSSLNQTPAAGQVEVDARGTDLHVLMTASDGTLQRLIVDTRRIH